MVGQARYLPLKFKFGAILVGFLILTLGTLGLFLNVFNTQTLSQQIKERDQMYARNVQQSINQVLFAGKYQAQAYVESLVARDPHVRYVIIIDMSRRAIASSDPSQIGTLFNDPVTKTAFDDINNIEPLFQTVVAPKEIIHDLSLPYEKGYLREPAGIIRIGISASDEIQIIRTSRLYTFLLIALFLLAGVLLTVLLSFYLSSKLNRLVQATNRFGNGDYRAQVPISPVYRDELDVLGIAFNQMAQKLQAYAEGLEHQVQERTEQLKKLNDTLLVQYIQLKELDRLKDDFLSVISHELRTPLNAILGFGSLLEDEVPGGLNQAQHEYLRKLMDATDRLLFLVNDLLDYARMQAGRFSVYLEETDYAALVKEVVGSFEHTFKDHHLEVALEITGPELLRIDRQRIFQVLANLISNSIKFTPEGGRIEVKVYPEGNELVTTIHDTGIGISPVDLAKLFTPFKQLDMGLTRRAGGVGLGLSICKGIIEAHHGTISARSPGVGHGSTFCFSLPLVNASRIGTSEK